MKAPGLFSGCHPSVLGLQSHPGGSSSSASLHWRLVVSWSQLHFREGHGELKALPVVPAHSLQGGEGECQNGPICSPCYFSGAWKSVATPSFFSLQFSLLQRTEVNPELALPKIKYVLKQIPLWVGTTVSPYLLYCMSHLGH